MSVADSQPAMDRLVFHHAGVACVNIEAELAQLAPLGYVAEGLPFVDPRQGIRGQFASGANPRLELLETLEGPEGAGGALAPWLRSRVKLYHLAYETANLDAAIAAQRASGAKLVVKPVEAVAFQGRKVAFVMLRNRLLIELIARE
jgi:glyoxalase/bleomycin resistance protein/dioxygenase superfamily protein